MMSIEYILSALGDINSSDRETLICAILENGVKGKFNISGLRDMDREYYFQQASEDRRAMTPKEIMDEYCETYGFEFLVDELASRREEGEDDEL